MCWRRTRLKRSRRRWIACRPATGVTLGGTLQVTKLNGYVPAAGTTFAFLSMTGAPVTGNSGTVSGGFTANYTGTSAILRTGVAFAYTDWAAADGLIVENAGPGADPDGDGLCNF